MDIAVHHASPDHWLKKLGHLEIPVLRGTIQALEGLRQKRGAVVARDISHVILHDPMLALRVLRYLQIHRGGARHAEITTIEHAILMLGIDPFFSRFGQLPVAEDTLAGHPAALAGFLGVVARARQAALYAGDWAWLRHDLESDEVMIAALLHDMAEMLMWWAAPELMTEIARRLEADPGLRSAQVQQAVLGFRLAELQLALAVEWGLPDLLCLLMDSAHAQRPRVRNVDLAVALARHTAHGWWDAALADDMVAAQDFLGLPALEVQRRIFARALTMLRERQWYGLQVAWLPSAPLGLDGGPWYAVRTGSGDYGQQVWRAVIGRLVQIEAGHRHTLGHVHSVDLTELLALGAHALHYGLGLARVAFLELDAAQSVASAVYLAGRREAVQLQGLALPCSKEVLAQMNDARSCVEMRDVLLPCLPPELRQTDFIAAPLAVGGRTLGLLYADGLTGNAPGYLFPELQQLCARMAGALGGIP